MTKTLTEQWREGTLPKGLYYVKDWDGTINRFVAQNNILWRDSNNPIYSSERIEVLAPVPSYDEIKRLEKKLAIATKALERYEDKQNWDIRGVSFMKYNKGFTIAHKALKEMEGVK